MTIISASVLVHNCVDLEQCEFLQNTRLFENT